MARNISPGTQNYDSGARNHVSGTQSYNSGNQYCHSGTQTYHFLELKGITLDLKAVKLVLKTMTLALKTATLEHKNATLTPPKLRQARRGPPYERSSERAIRSSCTNRSALREQWIPPRLPRDTHCVHSLGCGSSVENIGGRAASRGRLIRQKPLDLRRQAI